MIPDYLIDLLERIKSLSEYIESDTSKVSKYISNYIYSNAVVMRYGVDYIQHTHTYLAWWSISNNLIRLISQRKCSIPFMTLGLRHELCLDNSKMSDKFIIRLTTMLLNIYNSRKLWGSRSSSDIPKHIAYKNDRDEWYSKFYPKFEADKIAYRKKRKEEAERRNRFSAPL